MTISSGEIEIQNTFKIGSLSFKKRINLSELRGKVYYEYRLPYRESLVSLLFCDSQSSQNCCV